MSAEECRDDEGPQESIGHTDDQLSPLQCSRRALLKMAVAGMSLLVTFRPPAPKDRDVIATFPVTIDRQHVSVSFLKNFQIRIRQKIFQIQSMSTYGQTFSLQHMKDTIQANGTMRVAFDDGLLMESGGDALTLAKDSAHSIFRELHDANGNRHSFVFQDVPFQLNLHPMNVLKYVLPDTGAMTITMDRHTEEPHFSHPAPAILTAQAK